MSLITEVLTSSHLQVLGGTNHLSRPDIAAERRDVQKIIVHEKYDTVCISYSRKIHLFFLSTTDCMKYSHVCDLSMTMWLPKRLYIYRRPTQTLHWSYCPRVSSTILTSSRCMFLQRNLVNLKMVSVEKKRFYPHLLNTFVDFKQANGKMDLYEHEWIVY